MQNLEVKDAILTTKKTKSEIKKELEESIANGKENESRHRESQKDAVKVIYEFEKTIKNKKSDIVWLAYYQGKTF